MGDGDGGEGEGEGEGGGWGGGEGEGGGGGGKGGGFCHAAHAGSAASVSPLQSLSSPSVQAARPLSTAGTEQRQTLINAAVPFMCCTDTTSPLLYRVSDHTAVLALLEVVLTLEVGVSRA